MKQTLKQSLCCSYRSFPMCLFGVTVSVLQVCSCLQQISSVLLNSSEAGRQLSEAKHTLNTHLQLHTQAQVNTHTCENVSAELQMLTSRRRCLTDWTQGQRCEYRKQQEGRRCTAKVNYNSQHAFRHQTSNQWAKNDIMRQPQIVDQYGWDYWSIR